MNYWLTQFLSALGGQVLAARNRDKDSGWVQILFFVIVSVFWAIGSIVKSKANKTVKGKEQTPSKPVRKPPESTVDLRMLKQLFGLSGEAESDSHPIPEQPKPQAAKLQVRPVSRKVVRDYPARMAKPEEIPESPAETVKKLEGKPVAAPAEIPRTKYLSDILSDYEDPEKLRRAILHYEILGKPVSLREPSEQIMGF